MTGKSWIRTVSVRGGFITVLMMLTMAGGGAQENDRLRESDRVEEPRPERSPASKEHHEELAAIYNEMTRFFIQFYPSLQNRRELQQHGGENKRVKELTRRLTDRIPPRLKKIREMIDELTPADRRQNRKQEKVRKIYQYLEEFTNKLLKDRSSSGRSKRERRRYSKRKRLEKGLARPSLIRRKFLTELFSEMKQYGIQRSSVSSRVQSLVNSKKQLYGTAAELYLERLRTIRKKDPSSDRDSGKSKREEDQGQADRERKPSGASADENTSGLSTSEYRKKIESMIKREKELQNRLNGLLSLFRGRKRLPSDQSMEKSRLLRLKRDIGKLDHFLGDDVFSNLEKRKTILTFISQFMTEHHRLVFQDQGPRLKSMFLSVQSNVSELLSKDDTSQIRDAVHQLEADNLRPEIPLSQIRKQLTKYPPAYLQDVARYLQNDFGKPEKQFGRRVEQIAVFFQELVPILKKTIRIVRKLEHPDQHLELDDGNLKQQVRSIFDPEKSNLNEQLKSKFQQKKKVEIISDDIQSVRLSWPDE